MSITVTPQKSNTWKKRIHRPGLSGSTYLLQRSNGKVDVSASADHQPICQRELGPNDKIHSLESYIMWGDVSATKIVDVIYQIELGRSK
jgi:hypothetical protein